MRILYLIILLVGVVKVSGQDIIRGQIKVSNSEEALPFSNVAVKSSYRGVITNEDGVFKILVDAEKDSLVISYLGFETKIVEAKAVLNNPIIYLERSSFTLEEIVVRPNDDYLYEAVFRCREKMKQVASYQAKSYLEVSTTQNQQPVELVQCYFNSDIQAGGVKDLAPKAGRAGLAPAGDQYFVNLETSKAITRLDILEKNSSFPVNPLQFRKKKLRRFFRLEQLPTSGEASILRIKFSPKKKRRIAFSGELWIDEKTSALLKIECLIEDAQVHPFVSLRPEDDLAKVDFEISQSYQAQQDQVRLVHFNFNYQVRYVRAEDKNSAKDINTKGLLYVYDHQEPFVLPFFDYDPAHHDYRKISFLPYQSFFWTGENLFELTEEQKAHIDFFLGRGKLVNFQNDVFFENEEEGLFHPNNIFWSKDRRISLQHHLIQREEEDAFKQESRAFVGTGVIEMEKLKVQLFLDINEVGDSIVFLSKTVLDIFQTTFYEQASPSVDAYVNIYFDLCEIQRRKMEDQLAAMDNRSVAQIKEVYQQAVSDMEKMSSKYHREVRTGENFTKLLEWNDLVAESLGIDNMALTGLLEK